jgi:hypothetical protein
VEEAAVEVRALELENAVPKAGISASSPKIAQYTYYQVYLGRKRGLTRGRAAQ